MVSLRRLTEHNNDFGRKVKREFSIYGEDGINDKTNRIAQMMRNALLRVFGSSLLKIRESHRAIRPVIRAEIRM